MFIITELKDEFTTEDVERLLKQAYWAKNRSHEVNERAIQNSLCFGAISKSSNQLIGFARVITDYATTFYICDVIVDEQNRGHGIGKALIDTITKDERLAHQRGMLLTKDAHGLYEHYGFYRDGTFYMGKNPE